ncbi:amidohydrolase family protein [Bosea psychrotolerans]|uniref:Putative TIM-barrel fold metal-dependent hydrolase n=1 Tax=Bosea psychrotolerans TaxID=1871628 RepID=A0A2S4M118_9HYPH|nr:amidohydrolase family protein [Bosea psychrotolerans]POR48327.1 putative TIM-barrel fold metal-dependent hydrolase [Bosea psychrotolerans]
MRRRDFLAATAATLSTAPMRALAEPVPFSTGTQPPRLKLPALACDCHMHIYDSRFPAAANATLRPPDASVSDYRKLQRRLGSGRNVVVTPSTYGTDNRVTLAAIEAFGQTARGIGVVGPDVTPAELKALHDGGIRGIRFNLAVGAFLKPEMIAPTAKKIAALGWHIQVNMAPELLVALGDTLAELPTPIVLDHLARIPQPAGISHPAFAVVRRLLDKGHGWVKLSGAYISSADGSADFADAGAVAAAFVKAAPERMLWGSDWPHPTKTDKPDDAFLLDLVGRWAPEEGTRQRIFVTNPATLFGF